MTESRPPELHLTVAEERAHAFESVTVALGNAQCTQEVVQIILLQVIDAIGAIAGGVIHLDQEERQLTVLGSVGSPELTERPWRTYPLDAPLPAANAIRERRDLFLRAEDSAQYPYSQHFSLPGAAVPSSSRLGAR